MDIGELAHQTVALLTPCLPYLVSFGDKAVEGVAKGIGEDVWKQAKTLWARIAPSVENKPAAAEAAEDLAKSPSDADTQTVFKVQIRKILEQDPALAAELKNFFRDAGQSGMTIQAIGKGSVAAHTISGSTISTGDQYAAPTTGKLPPTTT
ncbi:hypothetical protein [Paraburkholderia sp. J12]|uniref:hypothetical protein n=1 Tax=Paraburkholderia sp. J12 TaxID=2805432 RepID=UPI002ABD8B39|nr:hypothetical protein [Paraburkholderia sp. J12]